MIAAVEIAAAVFAVPQEGAAGGGHGDADLMGAACQQAALHQGQGPPGLQGVVKRHGGPAAGNGPLVKGDLLFDLVLHQEALEFPLRGI